MAPIFFRGIGSWPGVNQSKCRFIACDPQLIDYTVDTSLERTPMFSPKGALDVPLYVLKGPHPQKLGHSNFIVPGPSTESLLYMY
jgi:hypothetical protein